MEIRGAALPARLRALPARLGLAPRATRSGSPGWSRRPACSRCSRPSTARSRASRRSAARCRSRSTCKLQRRYAHLFGRAGRPDVIERIQAIADRNIALRASALLDEEVERVMDKPFAITLDVGSSLANKTGSLAHRARRLRRPPAALQPRLPGRREHPGVALRRRGGRRGLRARLAARSWRTTRSRRSWAGSATTRARPPATAASSTRRSGSTRSSASSATRRSSRAGRSRSTREPTGKRVLVVGAGPVGPLGRLPPDAARPRGDDPRRRADGRRDDALRHPEVPAAARRARRRGRSGSSTWA